MVEKKSKGDKRQRTRDRLVEAAAEIINEKGFDLVSLEEVSRRAGMTRGAFYNNFKNKEELFLAVADKLWHPLAPAMIPGASFREQMTILGKAVAAAAQERRPIAIGVASFQVYALTHEDMRERLSRANAEIYKWAEQQLLQFVVPDDLPVTPDEFVRIVHALTEGLMMMHFLTPDLVTEETMVLAFESLAGPL
jgi:AcrR family transcriptional regulator